MKRAGLTTAAILAGFAMAASASAQSLRDYGQADGWQVKQIDNDACVLMKYLGGSEDTTLVFYRFEPGRAVEMNISTPVQHSTPNPNSVDWNRLDPVDIEYAIGSGGRFGPPYRTGGHIGQEYESRTRIRQITTFELDAAAVDRIAAGDQLEISTGPGSRGRVALGRATRAVALARQCVSRLR